MMCPPPPPEPVEIVMHTVDGGTWMSAEVVRWWGERSILAGAALACYHDAQADVVQLRADVRQADLDVAAWQGVARRRVPLAAVAVVGAALFTGGVYVGARIPRP